MQKEREGEILMVMLSVLESLFPIFSLYSIALIGAIYSYAFVVVIALVVLTAILTVKKQWWTLFVPKAQKDLLWTSFYITLLFLLLFTGLRYTTAGNVAVLVFLQLFFAYLYFNILGSERMTPLHTIGAFVMGAGAVIMLFPEDLQFNIGDGLALAAAAIAPVANLYQKRARKHVGTITILTYRNLVALPFLLLIAFFFEPLPIKEHLISAIPYLLANGILIYVIAKIFWIEALHRISITKMSAMVALIPLFTLLFAYLFLGEIPTFRQIFGILPILAGGYLITRPAA
ncbi:MAG: DMT family transporter [Campylobacterota bacterium]|nr:DMT family transporter [Campylobacterota bacterium]